LIPISDRVKREWIANYVKGQRGDDFFVAVFNGRTIGFNAVLNSFLQDSQVRVIDLIGVDRAFQRHGTGKKLLEHFIHDSFGKYSLLRVGTQIANIPSMRLYAHFGFYIAEAAYVLHAHVRNGEVVQ
jgi:ribosomal protein S18 acetylase RimI-like enzyme